MQAVAVALELQCVLGQLDLLDLNGTERKGALLRRAEHVALLAELEVIVEIEATQKQKFACQLAPDLIFRNARSFCFSRSYDWRLGLNRSRCVLGATYCGCRDQADGEERELGEARGHGRAPVFRKAVRSIAVLFLRKCCESFGLGLPVACCRPLCGRRAKRRRFARRATGTGW